MVREGLVFRASLWGRRFQLKPNGKILHNLGVDPVFTVFPTYTHKVHVKQMKLSLLQAKGALPPKKYTHIYIYIYALLEG